MEGQGSFLAMLPSLILMIAIFYFMLIRPQRKREKKLREMLAALKIGDEVASIGGIHGKILRIKDDAFVLETGVGTNKGYITIERGSISRLIKEAPAKGADVTPVPVEADETTETTEE